MAERVVIIIDGSNFYHRLREAGFHKIIDFDYGAFSTFLAGKKTVIWKRYYISRSSET